MMKSRLWAIMWVLLGYSVSSDAQVGLTIAYDQMSSDDFEIGDGMTSYEDDPAMVEIGIGYWFRLKQRRLEFLPAVYYGLGVDDHSELQSYGVRVQAMAYLLDFLGDCDCPTFSKENDLIKKGWHVGLMAGVGRLESTAEDIEWDNEVYHIGAMTGLDIGISNLLTITPELRLLYRDAISSDEVEWSPGVDLQPALRLTLRFDEKNYGFKRNKRRRRR